MEKGRSNALSFAAPAAACEIFRVYFDWSERHDRTISRSQLLLDLALSEVQRRLKALVVQGELPGLPEEMVRYRCDYDHLAALWAYAEEIGEELADTAWDDVSVIT